LGRRAAILLQQERDRNGKVKEVIQKEKEKTHGGGGIGRVLIQRGGG